MKNLRSRFERFCYRHRNKGIPSLMMYICIGSAVVYLMSTMAGNTVLYNFLRFDRDLIFRGQVWRLISYPLTYSGGSLLMTLIGFLCYYSLGRAIEHQWGTLRFNLFYLSGMVMMDIYCLIFPDLGGFFASNMTLYLNMSLFISYATLYPNAHFLLFFIIPVKAWIFALFDLALTFYNVIQLSVPQFLFPYNLFPLVALANYFLFFGSDVANIIPMSWRVNVRRLFKKKSAPPRAKVVPFPKAGSYQAETAVPQAPYMHKCTVCGRTDLTNPELEFRYCSRCKGYYCYCQDHISSHTHIQ